MAQTVQKTRSQPRTRSEHPLTRFFERLDPDRFPEAFWPFGESGRIRVEQQATENALIVRAELPAHLGCTGHNCVVEDPRKFLGVLPRPS